MINTKNRAIGLCMALVVIVFSACEQMQSKNELPILGRKHFEKRVENGKITYDTLDHTIDDFKFVDQDSLWVTNETFAGKIYVADFFFTSCPTICPAMKKQMLRVYEKYEMNERVGILSHTIDPKYDSVVVLKEFADALGVKSEKWHFVTGDMDDIYNIGERSYLVTAGEDETAPGGYIHNGAFLLVDEKRRIRGVYDGTVPEKIDKLLYDIDVLLAETNK